MGKKAGENRQNSLKKSPTNFYKLPKLVEEQKEKEQTESEESQEDQKVRARHVHPETSYSPSL